MCNLCCWHGVCTSVCHISWMYTHSSNGIYRNNAHIFIGNWDYIKTSYIVLYLLSFTVTMLLPMITYALLTIYEIWKYNLCYWLRGSVLVPFTSLWNMKIQFMFYTVWIADQIIYRPHHTKPFLLGHKKFHPFWSSLIQQNLCVLKLN